MALVFAVSATADDMPRYTRDGAVYTGAGTTAAKAARDTFLLMGSSTSGAAYVGDFESGAKALSPPINGWTSLDITQPTASNWEVTNFDWSDLAEVPGYEPVADSQSAWCGDREIVSCDGALDVTGGYAGGWNDLLEFRGTVTNNGNSCTLNITAQANVYSEPGYDGMHLNLEKFDIGMVELNYWDGITPALAISESGTYLTGEYMGVGADEVVIVWQFQSDGGWDDGDCSFPTAGAFILDNVAITSDNGVSALEDFEGIDPGDYGFDATIFATRLPQGVGDFAKVWNNLEDEDPCATNYSNCIAFIDDGVIVPGTGASPCQDWCYGPNGFIVTTTGGLAGPTSHIHNAVESPYMVWGDPTHRGGVLTFTCYRHEDLSADAPGSFYTWSVRSVNTGVPADLEGEAWADRNFVYYGGPDYIRVQQVVSDLLVPSLTHVQIQLTVYELGWAWGWNGNDGYPAPYFDNVRLESFPIIGPGLATREIDLANDNFPALGTIDMGSPGLLSVRFDATQDISPPTHLNPAVGDSFCFDAVVTRAGAVLDPPTPTLHYKVKRNPVFAGFKTSLLPDEGSVACGQVTNPAGIPVPDRYFGDLDDNGFLFPGDIVHYYVSATDQDTNTFTLETSIMPADTTGYSDFVDALSYPSGYTVRCLPSISDLTGTQPPIIFWNDFANRGGQQEWYSAFANLGLIRGSDFDEYYTNGPSSGVGNGLGGRATPLQIAGYETMLYTAGDLSVNTISNGDLASDSGNDADLLIQWLDSGNKNLYATGDDLASDLAQAGLVTGNLLGNYFNVISDDRDVRDLIDGQVAPIVLPTPSETIFNTVGSWIAYGGCGVINTFDAVTATGLGTRIAVWADGAGNDGGYSYSACTIASGVGTGATSEVISMPYDFMYIYTNPAEVIPVKADATTGARVRVLQDILARFGIGPNPGDISGTNAPRLVMSAKNAPNPFNPSTEISFVAPRNGLLTLKIYNVRGELVRTLLNENVTAGPDFVEWNGKDHRGSQVASGVYFYEVRQGSDVVVNKMALVK
jgi:hypothetical protein